MTILLLITCFLSPYSIAFLGTDDTVMRMIGFIIDGIFFIDIIVIFNTAIYDESMKLVVDRKKI